MRESEIVALARLLEPTYLYSKPSLLVVFDICDSNNATQALARLQVVSPDVSILNNTSGTKNYAS
jgi:hypothetical protein